MNHHPFCPAPRALLTAGLLAASLTAQSPVFRTFGDGCPGTHGTPSLESFGADLPRLGEDFTVRLSNLPPSGFAVGILGALEVVGGLTLPADLSVVGMPGCALYTSIRRQEGLVISGGEALWTTRVPGDVDLLGYTFFQQALVLDPPANALGWIASNAAEGMLGDRPELVITSGKPTANRLTVAPGETITLSILSMQNESFYVASGSFEVGWYLSGNSFVGSLDDTLLASQAVPSLDPRQRATLPQRTVRIPVGTPPGNYFLGPYLDRNREVQEWNEFANFQYVYITVTEPPTPLPDLTFPDGTPRATPDPVFPGQTLDIEGYRIRNQGNSSVVVFSTAVFLSEELVDIKGGAELARFSSLFLNAGADRNVNPLGVTIPADTPPGDYWLGFVVDVDETVPELDETNNVVARLVRVGQPKPNLRITSGAFGIPEVIPRPLPFLPFPMPVGSFTVINDGDAPSGPFSVGYYYAGDPAVSSGTVMDGVNHPGLAPGESYTFSAKTVLGPGGQGPGTKWIGIIVDDLDQVDESNEDDNIEKRPFVLI